MRGQPGKNADAIAVFTEVAADEIIAAGGSGHWVLNPDKASRCRYLVCCRKSRWNNKEEGVPNHGAFLVGVINKLVAGVANARGQRRYFIEISEFALLNKPKVWGNWRNPVKYQPLEKFGIDLKGLKFQAVSVAAKSSSARSRNETPEAPRQLTIPQAKKALAEALGVRPEDIEITIRS